MALIITREVQGLKPGTDVSDFGDAQKQLLLEWGAAKVVETPTKSKTRVVKNDKENPLSGKDQDPA